ncbi:MAG: hypothetical protein ABJO02_01970 [Reichenbachiella sp.]|uniref:hypothetical protein n=1 Tax=Reichenbachiella sp. TaxID=2184521 RepID=UPI0032987990
MQKPGLILSSVIFLFLFTKCDSSEDEKSIEYPESIEILDQSELDKFAINQYEIINGDLVLHGVNDISALHTLREIRGNVLIGSTSLSSLEGLHNLRKIEGDLNISWNDDLEDLSAFSNLDSLHGELTIRGQPKLISLEGFQNVTYIGNGVKIAQNGLKNFSGFESVKQIDGSIEILRNLNTKEISAFENLESIRYSLLIEWNDELETISGFSNLQSIEYGSFVVSANKNLTDLCGFQQLDHILITPSISGNSYNPTIEEIREGYCAK